MKLPLSILSSLILGAAIASAANVVYNGTALKNLQGTPAGDITTAGKLGLLILDTTGDGIGGATNKTVLPTSAGLDVGGTFGGDLIIARLSSVYSLGDATIGGNWTWNTTLYPGSTSKRWAIVWFENLTNAGSTGTAPAGTKYGIASGTNWVTPSSEPGSGTTLTYGAAGPLQITLTNGDSSDGGTSNPTNAQFATNGTSFTIVPEASSALLGLLGLAGLVRRRRN